MTAKQMKRKKDDFVGTHSKNKLARMPDLPWTQAYISEDIEEYCLCFTTNQQLSSYRDMPSFQACL
jgi:hypothetical protein